MILFNRNMHCSHQTRSLDSNYPRNAFVSRLYPEPHWRGLQSFHRSLAGCTGPLHGERKKSGNGRGEGKAGKSSSEESKEKEDPSKQIPGYGFPAVCVRGCLNLPNRLCFSRFAPDTGIRQKVMVIKFLKTWDKLLDLGTVRAQLPRDMW